MRELTVFVHTFLTFVLIPLGWADSMKAESNKDEESIPLTALLVDCLYSAAVWFALYKLISVWFD